ncbi:polysaccharide deacetylase family protein [Lysinibacillus sp. KU-BSD001]|uniref:polysaccharide deacetylase family protein n=1 Tax=Lysinibacillus sp. KU-BSD001 TaxID=3141328 RepID=UPI0036EDEED0
MKKILFLSLFFYVWTTQQLVSYAINIDEGQSNVFYVKTNSAPVYDESGAVLGVIHKNQAYFYMVKTETCYYIEVENHLGCVSTASVVEGSTTFVEEKLERTGEMIYTTDFTQLTDLDGHVLYTSQPNRRHYAVAEDDTYYYVKLAGRTALLQKVNTALDKGIPVLMYHHIVGPHDGRQSLTSAMITEAQFASNVRALQEVGAQAITMDELHAFLQGEKNLGKNAVVITFDDGLKSNIVYAYPLLQQAKMKATNFVITSRVPTTTQPFDPHKLQSISQEEIAWSTDVFNYEGHTHQLHSQEEGSSLVVLQSRKSLKDDLLISQSIVPQHYFAYPFGQFNEATKQILTETGYRLAFTTKHGYVKYGDNSYELKRIAIEPTTTEEQFRQYISY